MSLAAVRKYPRLVAGENGSFLVVEGDIFGFFC